MLNPDKTRYERVVNDYTGDDDLVPDWTTEIDPEWNDYDKTVARCHMSNYGRIYLVSILMTDGMDTYPDDDEYEVEERHALATDLATC